MTTLSRMREAPGIRRGLLWTQRCTSARVIAISAVIPPYTARPSAGSLEDGRDSPSRRNPSDGPLLHCRTEPLPAVTQIGHGVTPKRGPVDRAARCAGGRLPLGMGRRDPSHHNHFINPSVGVVAARHSGDAR